MHNLLIVQQKIVPDLIAVLEKRYTIIRTIQFLQPIGRRNLAHHLGVGERQLRKELDFMCNQGLVVYTQAGTSLTAEGTALLWDLNQYMHQLKGLATIEERLEERFGLQQVVVVPGDMDQDGVVGVGLARAAGTLLRKNLRENDIVAVSGGGTLAQVANHLAPSLTNTYREITFVPSRGGLGEELELQANTIASKMAQKLGAKHRLLHVPDNVGVDTISALEQEPTISQVLGLIRSATVLLFSIGEATVMARRRGLPAEELALLQKKKAVGEAFGYYLDQWGEVVHFTPSMGMSLEDLAHVKLIVTVAGGKSKARAMMALLTYQPRGVLVTDEGAATELLKLGGSSAPHRVRN